MPFYSLYLKYYFNFLHILIFKNFAHCLHKKQKNVQMAQLLCSLLAATSQLSVLIGYKMQLADGHKGNEMHNEIFAD